MKVSQVKSEDMRVVLTGMIVHDSVLATVHSKLGEEKYPFGVKWADTICRWCRDYHVKYQKAPRKHIRSLFSKYAAKQPDEETVDLMETFLSRLSKDHAAAAEEMNEKFVLDTASAYFERVLMQRQAELVQTALEARNLEEAKAHWADYRGVNFSSSAWSSPFDEESIKQTLRHYEKERGLVQWPGELDRFLSPFFEREGFISFAAPEKRGKSFWLMETVHLALRQRRRVLYYVLGDMSQDQAYRRYYSRLTRRPMRSGDVRTPTQLVIKENQPRVLFKNEHRDKATFQEIWRAMEKLKQSTATKEVPLKVRCEGADVVSASDIERDVEEFSKTGWVPDVVVVDYLDLLAPESSSGSLEFRHQLNQTWKIMRRISLKYHCLVVGATQAAASSYDAKVIRKKDFSEDKRKNAHVTGMIGINQTSEEKLLGVYRLNWIFLRDGEWTDTQVAWTAGSLAIGSPCIISSLGSKEG